MSAPDHRLVARARQYVPRGVLVVAATAALAVTLPAAGAPTAATGAGMAVTFTAGLAAVAYGAGAPVKSKAR
ncbi:hypothetical protein [Streptomyces spectabilis]|uniref:Uncharacterized protein n=1 Tax=Streptomyces spectabilis TaxID=68270 RepID=A0A5P2X838_STRST|nr:hypothetical protein [Streptomyces spectabilis]MBB5108318.1 hypothetical protein [Streptomyces spectabilis]MCI3901077.1 hypothetical protein [Streptomyces spectabilis]QEV58572.1 hypothetical protein CP982_07475 [Streptomyces spectabilis]GGV45834.1 hypothetical protein GCM10010245_71800 [Streptomyces spectabilis]